MIKHIRHRPKVVAVVAAYNEGPRIGRVIEVLSSYPRFDQIVIVDDGSTDDTFLVALRSRPPEHNIVVHTGPNQGKGAAMDIGVQIADPDVIFFCDADIIGLSHSIIHETLAPVLRGDAGMMIAMRGRDMYARFPWTIEMVAKLGGERAVTRKLWESVPARFKSRFMIETALNYIADRSCGFDYEIMPQLTQVIKEQKQGFFHGLVGRIKMIADIIIAHIVIRLSK